MFWKIFKNKKPTKNGWYQCTVEVPNQQRYVMDLYWHNELQRFKDNRRQNVYDTYNVLNYKNEKMYTERLCDRTENVVAWKKLPRTYMKGFVEEKWY